MPDTYNLNDIYILKKMPSYFDRRIFFYSSLAEYLALGTADDYEKKTGINFNPADGVRTSLVINTNTDAFKYLLVVNPTTNAIESRWFIVEGDRNSKGQYTFQLKRDSIADNFNATLLAPIFLEKGKIKDPLNPLLFNKEGMTFNQIKKEEIALKDKTGVAWLCGYILQDNNRYPSGSAEIYAEDPYNSVTAIAYGDLSFGDAIEFSDGTQSATKRMVAYSSDQLDEALRFIIGVRRQNTNYALWSSLKFDGAELGMAGSLVKPLGQYYIQNVLNYVEYTKYNINLAMANYPADYASFKTYVKQIFLERSGLQEAPQGIWDYNGKIIIKDGVYYRLNLEISGGTTNLQGFTFNESDYRISSILKFLRESIDRTYNVGYTRSDYGLLSSFYNNDDVKAVIRGELSLMSITATPVDVGTVHTHISASRNHITDDCFDMFAIPYMPEGTKNYLKQLTPIPLFGSINLPIALSMARAIMTEGGAGTGWAKDLQLLPYCPFDDQDILNNKTLCLANLTEDQDYSLIKDSNDNVVSFMLYGKKSNFTKNIEFKKEIFRERDDQYLSFDFKAEDEPMTYTAGANPPTSAHHDFYMSLASTDIGALYIKDYAASVLIQKYEGNDPSDPQEEDWVDYSTDPRTVFIDKVNNRIRVRITQTQATDLYRVTLSVVVNYLIPGDYINPLYEDLKVSNECDLYRLVSPNYNGMFEFSLCKFLEGKINYINVDCTYKPFQPYLHLNPDFSGLYGQDWNDSTGLICGGDYSLSLISDPWTNYVLANKNYQALFDRGIQSLDVNNAINMEKQRFSSIVGAFTAPIGAAAGGALAGIKAGPYAAMAGAAVGFAGGLATGITGGIMDIDWLNRQQREQRQYSLDMYGYTLGNIRALPQSISKSSPFTYNNKIFPIFERFSCTDKERALFKEKLKYEGMTIMSISTISEYVYTGEETYIKGRLIRATEIEADSHLIEDIYYELAKGVYINL